MRQTYTKCNFCTLNNVYRCTHCYLYGTDDHHARNCLSKSYQENCCKYNEPNNKLCYHSKILLDDIFISCFNVNLYIFVVLM